MLDPEASTPLYHQLADWLESRVLSGELCPGDRIESEPSLSRRFGIGRPTVRQATELLVRRGMLERRQGAGTFVRDRPDHIDLLGLGGTLASFRQSGIEVDTRVLEGPVPHGDGLLRLVRLHCHRGQPLVLEELHLSGSYFQDLLPKDVQTLSLSRFVREELGLRLHEARQAFRVAIAEAERAERLECQPGTPLLHVQRGLSFQGAGLLVETDLYCRTDKFTFSQTLQGDA